MEVLLNAKHDEDLQYVIKKGKEHLLESFKKDLMSIDELLAYTLDFINEIENVKEELEDLKTEYEEYRDNSKLVRNPND